jgi:hypothetical protein
MKSAALPSFWEAYRRLDRVAQEKARKSFQMWMEDPFHPSLHFKCINSGENIWSVRVSSGLRALGVWEGENFTWFWIGGHTEYERYFGG